MTWKSADFFVSPFHLEFTQIFNSLLLTSPEFGEKHYLWKYVLCFTTDYIFLLQNLSSYILVLKIYDKSPK